MKRRPEVKREEDASCSILSLNRPVHVRVDRRVDGYIIFKVNQDLYLGCLSDYGSILLLTALVRTRMPGGVGVAPCKRMKFSGLRRPPWQSLASSQVPSLAWGSGDGHCEA